MKSILAILIALFLLPLGAHANDKIKGMPSGIYKLDKSHASITWKVSHLGLSKYTARFTKFDADLLFDALAPEKSKIKVTIDPTSVRTDYPNSDKKDFDKQLATDAGWFNGSQFPEITFLSNDVKKTSDTTGKITGNLTFLGIKKPITLDVTFNTAIGNHPFANKPALGFSATGLLKRSDFGMKTYIPQIGDEVQIIIETEFMYAQ